MMRSAWCRGAAAVLLCLAANTAGLRAQTAPRSEYEVKAAYLFTFGRFVEWPPRATAGESTFAVCILGSDPFGATLDATIGDATVRGRRVTARRLAAAAEASSCDILFVSGSEASRLQAILDSVRGLHVLTVSDIPAFTNHGGMIGFVKANNRVRFEINVAAGRDAALTMSSDLLNVASAVRDGPPARNE
jgi:hypothetical protein